MKGQVLFHIVIGFISLFFSIGVAIAQEYRVVEIDSVEYYSAKCGFEKQNYFLDSGPGYGSDAKEFLYRIVASDDSARDIYLEEIISDGDFSHEFSCVNFSNSLILFLQFDTPIESFLYAAAKQYDTPISISNTKINSAPIVISKDGYIAGFKDVGDAFLTDLKIYKMEVGERANLDIAELFSYSNYNDSWHISYEPFAAFWKNGDLYIEGLKLEKSNADVNVTESCYFKIESK